MFSVLEILLQDILEIINSSISRNEVKYDIKHSVTVNMILCNGILEVSTHINRHVINSFKFSRNLEAFHFLKTL